MLPSLRLMLAATLSALVILVIASSALVSMRRPEMPMVLHPAGSRPLLASWQTDDMRSFEARFGPQAMLVNAAVQLPPTNLPANDAPARLEFVAIASAMSEPARTLEPAKVEPAKSAAISIPDIAATVAAEPVAAPAPVAPPITVTPPVIVSPVAETAPAAAAPVLAAPSVVANIDVEVASAPKAEPTIVVAAIAPIPAPAKDPQVATDAPAQPSEQTAALLPAAPAQARPSFVDTSRAEPILKPAIKRRAQIKRPKKRVVRATAPAAKPAAKPAAPTNPFAALFGSSVTP